MMYYYNPNRKKTAAHLWTGSDTYCRMLSTGGLTPGRKIITEKLDSRRICLMCQNNYKNKHPVEERKIPF